MSDNHFILLYKKRINGMLKINTNRMKQIRPYGVNFLKKNYCVKGKQLQNYTVRHINILAILYIIFI